MHFNYDFLCLIPSTTASHVSIYYIYIYISALKQKKKVGYFNYFFRCNILFRFFLNPRKRLLHNKLLNWFPTLHSSSHISLSRRFYAKFSIKKDSLNIMLRAEKLSNKGKNTNRNKSFQHGHCEWQCSLVFGQYFLNWSKKSKLWWICII